MSGRTGKNLKKASIGWSEGRGGRITADKNMGGLLKSQRNGEGQRWGWRNMVLRRCSGKKGRLGEEDRWKG